MENGLTKAAIEKIQELVEGQEKTIELNGDTYSRFGYKRVYSDPRPSSLSFSTLDGVSDYINENLDGVNPEECMIVIDSYEQVSIWSPVKGETNDRHLIAKCKLTEMEKFSYGKWYEQEAFIIAFSAMFGNTDDKATLLSATSIMQVIDQTGGEDTGATTNREASNQVICPGVDPANMPKTVVKLKPFRTFREVDQPESAFIFRYKGVSGHPVVALFEADGGAWKLAAKANIKEYLKEKVKSPIIC